MARLATALLAGALLGAVTVWFIRPAPVPRETVEIVRDIVVVDTMSQRAAEGHREDNYRKLATIAEVYALPTEFARIEALYALGGRLDAEAVQALIFDANRIADEINRNAALDVLFFRLAELDPASALALSRTEFFRGVRNLERRVWMAWGRNDLDAALAMAASLSGSRRSFAAQNLFAAHGNLGNETTDRIEAELGVEPDRNTRGRHLYKMADRSLAEAIQYINGLDSFDSQQTLTWWLAYYVAQQDPLGAMQAADLFANASLKTTFRNHLTEAQARRDPQAALRQAMATGTNLQNNGAFRGALEALVKSDRAAALDFYAGLTRPAAKDAATRIIAGAIAQEDPEEALRWARENASGRGRLQMVEMTIVSSLAYRDPERAMQLVQTIDSPNRAGYISNVVSVIAQRDPETAEQYLDLIDSPVQKVQARSELASAWIQTDPDAAVNWMLKHDKETAAKLIGDSIWSVIQFDTDLAVRLLPRLDESRQQSVRREIAVQMARTSPAEAQAFVRQFSGSGDYSRLQAAVIAGVAETDPILAQQLVSQITDPAGRDEALVTLVGRQAWSDPGTAIALTEQIVDENQREMAVGQVAQVLVETDPSAALQIIRELPDGRARSQAISTMARFWHDPIVEQLALVESIGDNALRQQATLSMIFTIARADPGRAQRMLDEMTLSAEERRMYEEMLLNIASRALSST
jgi:hypothetical protein